MRTLQSLEEFEQLKNNGLTAFLFTADWCPDCHFLDPFLPEIENHFPDFTFVSVDRDQFLDLCRDLNVFGIPSFIIYKDGKEIGRLVNKNRKTKEEVEEFLSTLSID